MFKSITQLRYNFRFSLQDGLLHAIKEEYVEAVEILLEWEEKTHKPGQAYVNSISSFFFSLSFGIFFILIDNCIINFIISLKHFADRTIWKQYKYSF